MNIFFQELRRSKKALLYWVLCQAALIFMGYMEFANVFRGNADVSVVMAQFPAPIMTLMGVAPGVDFSVVGDFFFTMADFGFYVMVIYASLLGFSIISREEAGKTAEFLFSKPVTRASVLAQKYTAGLLCCLIMGLMSMLVTGLTFGLDPDADLFVPILAWGSTSTLMSFVFFLAGGMFAACSRKVGGGGSLNLIFLLGSILMSRVVALLGLKGPVTALGVNCYFPMLRYMQTGSFGIWPFVMCGVWIVLFAFLARRGYQRRDFQA